MISPPGYKKDAIPTPRGWRHPRTNELLKCQSLTQEQIDEYLGVSAPAPIDESPQQEAQMIDESPSLDNMSKRELEELGREHGIELDRRKNKQDLIEELSTHMN